jgi:hypothetical protein
LSAWSTKPLLIKAPWGLGDAIYIRPTIADAAAWRTIYLETPWPELYEDLPLYFVKGEKGLRLQMRNVWRQQPTRWVVPPPGIESVALGYGPIELGTRNVFEAMAYKMPMPMRRAPVWDLPDMGECPVDSGGAPLALIRPVMRRLEWDNEARNPRPQYVAEIAGDLKARGYAVLVVCDIQVDRELLAEGVMPPHNLALTHGEMNTRQLLATMRDAAIVVGGVGWIIPAAVALRRPTFCVLGGNLGMNHPDVLLDPRMPREHIGFAMPDEPCHCFDMRHQCQKHISSLMPQWRRFLRTLPATSTRSSTVA